jgi:hypothetical protein
VATDPFDTAAYCLGVASGWCARQVACDPQYVALLFDDESGCRAYQTRACVSSDNGKTASMVGVTTSFSQANADACHQATATAACDVEPYLDTQACRRIFSGVRDTGQACWSHSQCLPTHYCAAISQATGCGTCQPRKGAAAGCAPGELCVDGFLCAGSSCRAYETLFARAGQPCGANNTVPVCAGEGTCVTVDTANQCRVVTTLAPGAGCDPQDYYAACPVTQECHLPNASATLGTCGDRPGPGATCDFRINAVVCTGRTFCSAWEAAASVLDGTCVARRGEGGDCSDTDLYGNPASTSDDWQFLVCGVDLDCRDTNGDSTPAGNTCEGPALGSTAPACP